MSEYVTPHGTLWAIPELFMLWVMPKRTVRKWTR